VRLEITGRATFGNGNAVAEGREDVPRSSLAFCTDLENKSMD